MATTKLTVGTFKLMIHFIIDRVSLPLPPLPINLSQFIHSPNGISPRLTNTF